MRFSLVIPAYNETGRIGDTVTHVIGYLEAQPFEWELLIVIDGGDLSVLLGAFAARDAYSQLSVLPSGW